MTKLTPVIRRRIARDGPMSVADYMALCLGHPEHGYYRKQDPLGASGDFTTAPEISQMFGEMIGLWLSEVWRELGSPTPVRLVELGPGRGTLMADALRAAARTGLAEAAEVWFVETSPTLRLAQAARVPQAQWAAALAEVPDGPTLLIANEFFDALPIRQFVRAGDGWRERMIGLDGEAVVWGLAPPGPAPAGLDPARAGAAAEGAVVEICLAAAAVAAEIGRRLAAAPGAALIVDYGYDGAATPAQGADTFQALRRHAHSDPLAEPGDADLTAHVDFRALADAAAAEGAVSHGPVPQGAFLKRLGVGLRAEALARRNPERADDVAGRLMRLTAPAAMGTLFKALALTGPQAPVPPGFEPAAP